MSIIEVIVSLPFLAALAIAFGAPARRTALGSAIFTGACTLLAVTRFSLSFEGRFQMESSHTILNIAEWPKVNLAFGVDGVSIVLMILTALVMLASIWSVPSKENITNRSSKSYYISCLLIGGGAMGAFCTTDLFFLYAFHEMALALTLLMIGSGLSSLRTEWKTLLFASAGSLCILIGLILLVSSLEAKTLDISDLIARARDSETGISVSDQGTIYLVLLAGFGILAGLFPFHSWIPSSLTKTPTPIAMLHSGVLKSFGVYGLLRIAEPVLPHGADDMRNLILILLLGNIIWIGFREVRGKTPDQLLSQFSIMFTGYAFLGIASGTRTGLIGTVLFLFAHGLSIALLFALSDKLRENDRLLDGPIRRLPRLAILFIFGGFAAIGTPGFATFPSLLMIFFGAFEPFPASGGIAFLQIAAFLSIIGLGWVVVCLPQAYRVFFPGDQKREADDVNSPRANLILILILLLPLVTIGFIPELLLRFLRAATEGISLIGGG